MWQRQTAGSVLCPSCGSLVGVNDETCLTCGRRRPGMWGFAGLLRNLGNDMGFVTIVLWGCGAVFLATLANNPEGITSGGLSFLSPSIDSELLFGASGGYPVFVQGHWWTLFSASWLHGGILHIVLNMMGVRNLAPVTADLYGAARTVIIYTVAGFCGFLASSAAWAFLPAPLRGGYVTVGASAPIFGLIGALIWYGRRGGSSYIGQQARGMAVGMLVYGFLVPFIDNWAHLGGLGGGWLMARILDPLKPERADHVVIALACLALSVAAVVASVVVGLAAR